MDIARNPSRAPSAAPDSDSDPGALDQYAEEFADLVQQDLPSRTDTPADWLARLPDDVFPYFEHGIATIGHEAQTDAQRRGRQYLLHAALVLTWMKWGKQGARERLDAQGPDLLRRVADLITLERYRRDGVLADYASAEWESRPVGAWEVSVVSAAVAADAVSDPDLREALGQNPVVQTDVDALTALRDAGALPDRSEEPLG